jgi:hypothetical protein
MKKIMLALDAAQININTIDFASYIANLTHSKLTGIFLEYLEREHVPVMNNLRGIQYSDTIPEAEISENNDLRRLCEENIHLFKEACKKKEINFSIHRDRGVPIEEIIIESRFADLLIVDAEMSFQTKYEKTPSGFVKEVLAKSECPVVIAPFTLQDVDEIVFAYDGSPSSVFAIKQFTYLFPEFSDKKITILQVNEKEDLPIINNHQIGELLQMHYSGIGFSFLHGKASDQLFSYLAFKNNAFVVMGAFGRSILSTFFRHSTAELVIKTNNLPVFIAHH